MKVLTVFCLLMLVLSMNSIRVKPSHHQTTTTSSSDGSTTSATTTSGASIGYEVTPTATTT